MKALFVTQPAFGHFQPTVPLASALVAAGHQVAYANSASFVPYIQKAGFPTFVAGLDWLEFEAERTFPHLKDALARGDHAALVTDVFADVAAQAMVPDLLEIIEQWKPDVMVRADYEFGSCLAAEMARVPLATCSTDFYFPDYVWDGLIGDQLAYLRSAFGLDPFPSVRMLTSLTHLSLMPTSMHFPHFLSFADSARMHHMQYVPQDMGTGDCLPAWLNDLPDQPNVCVTLGTVFNKTPGAFRTLIDALETVPCNLLLTLGHLAPEALGRLPNNVRATAYLPNSLLMPHCDLAIVHGGFNTMMTALRNGLPLVVMPISATQHYFAKRCVEMGLGDAFDWARHAGEAAMDGIQPFTPDGLLTSVKRLLSQPSAAHNAMQVAEQILELPTPAHLVNVLKEMAAESRHVSRATV